MSKLPLNKEQVNFILDCVENKGMSLAMVARQIGVDNSVFYRKIKNIPEIQRYKKKVTRGKTRKNKLTDRLIKKREEILFESNGSEPVDLDYKEDFPQRIPRIITKKDMDLLEEVVATGLPMHLVAKEIGIPKSTLYQYMNAHPEFKERIRLGRMKHYKECEKDMRNGKLDKSIYTYFSKTKWKDIFPQEDKHIQPTPVSVQGNLELRQTFIPDFEEKKEEE